MNFSAPAGRWRRFFPAPGDLLRRGVGLGAWVLGFAVLALFIARMPLERAAAGLASASILVATLIQPAVALVVLALAIPFGSLISVPLPGANVVDLLAGVVLLAWLGRGAAYRRIRLEVPPLAWPLLGLVWVLALSLTQAESWRVGLPEWVKWAEFAAMYLIAAQMLRPGSEGGDLPPYAWWVLGGLFLAGTAEVALGGYQFFRQVGPKAFILMDRFMRAYGTFNQPNPYAGYLGYLVPVAASLTIAGLGKWWSGRRARDLWVACACGLATLLFIAGMGMSWSRGAWLGLGAALLVVLLLRSRKYAPLSAGALAVLALAVILFGTSWLPGAFTRRLADLGLYSADVDLAHVEVNDDNFAVLERLGHWQAGTGMFNDHPWLGVGIGNYSVAYPAYAPAHFYDPLGHAHNVYLNFLAEAGILGGIAFGAFWLAAIWAAWRASRRGRGYAAALAVGVLGTLVYLSVHNLFDNLFVAHLQLQLALLLAMLGGRGDFA